MEAAGLRGVPLRALQQSSGGGTTIPVVLGVVCVLAFGYGYKRYRSYIRRKEEAEEAGVLGVAKHARRVTNHKTFFGRLFGGIRSNIAPEQKLVSEGEKGRNKDLYTKLPRGHHFDTNWKYFADDHQTVDHCPLDIMNKWNMTGPPWKGKFPWEFEVENYTRQHITVDHHLNEVIFEVPDGKPRQCLTNLPIPPSRFLSIEIIVNDLETGSMSFGLGYFPHVERSWNGSFPGQIAFSSEGVIYNGTRRNWTRSTRGGYQRGDVITMLIDRKFNHKELSRRNRILNPEVDLTRKEDESVNPSNGEPLPLRGFAGVLFLKNGIPCHDMPIVVGELRFPNPDLEEPPVEQTPREAMLLLQDDAPSLVAVVKRLNDHVSETPQGRLQTPENGWRSFLLKLLPDIDSRQAEEKPLAKAQIAKLRMDTGSMPTGLTSQEESMLEEFKEFLTTTKAGIKILDSNYGMTPWCDMPAHFVCLSSDGNSRIAVNFRPEGNEDDILTFMTADMYKGNPGAQSQASMHGQIASTMGNRVAEFQWGLAGRLELDAYSAYRDWHAIVMAASAEPLSVKEVQTKEAQSRKMRAVAKIASLAGGGDVDLADADQSSLKPLIGQLKNLKSVKVNVDENRCRFHIPGQSLDIKCHCPSFVPVKNKDGEENNMCICGHHAMYHKSDLNDCLSTQTRPMWYDQGGADFWERDEARHRLEDIALESIMSVQRWRTITDPTNARCFYNTKTREVAYDAPRTVPWRYAAETFREAFPEQEKEKKKKKKKKEKKDEGPAAPAAGELPGSVPPGADGEEAAAAAAAAPSPDKGKDEDSDEDEAASVSEDSEEKQYFPPTGTIRVCRTKKGTARYSARAGNDAVRSAPPRTKEQIKAKFKKVGWSSAVNFGAAEGIGLKTMDRSHGSHIMR